MATPPKTYKEGIEQALGGAPLLLQNAAPVATTNQYSSLTGTPTIPTKTSQLQNNSGYVNSAQVEQIIQDTGAPPTGPAGGDLTGTYPNPDIAAGVVTTAKMAALSGVSKLLGSNASTTAVTEITLGTGLSMSGSTLNASGGTGTVTSVGTAGLISGGTITTTGTITTYMSTNKLVGRGTAGPGIMEEITLGTNLSLTGTTLNAASPTSAALTRTNDTNVTITLGGSPTTALLAATSITAGWSGQLAASRGGTGLDTSASTGIAQVSAGTWSVSTALANGTTATTQTASDNSTKVATTAYVDTAAGQTLKLSGNVTTTSATAGNITGLSFSASASSVYEIDGFYHTGCDNTGGMFFAITIPASTTIYIYYFGNSSSATAYLSTTNAAGSTLTATAHNTQNNNLRGVFVKGTVTTAGTAGTVQFQYASAVAGQTSTIYQEGTYINVKKIG